MNTWVIPDIHGCLITLRYVIEKEIRLQQNDQLFILGDFVDRGPDSKGVIDYIMNLEAQGYMVTTIRGNHEDYMLKAIIEDQNPGFLDRFLGRNKTHKEWFRFGGEATLNSFEVERLSDIPQKYVDWLSALPYYTSWENYLIVHAGFNFKNDNIFEDEHAMMWIRDFDIDPEKLNGKKIIHGHVPVDLEFIFSCVNSTNFNFIALDNGVYMSNRPGYGSLTALELNTLDLRVIANMDF
jgi:serine/threonine protein phosphatase 1